MAILEKFDSLLAGQISLLCECVSVGVFIFMGIMDFLLHTQNFLISSSSRLYVQVSILDLYEVRRSYASTVTFVNRLIRIP